MSINNTLITGYNNTNNYYVKIQDEFECNGTVFENLWADNVLINNMLGDGGIQIMDSDTSITNSTVVESMVGFNIQTSNPYINNCDIYKVSYRHYYMTNSNPVIESTPIYKENIYSNDMIDSDSDQVLDYLEKYVYQTNISATDSDSDQILDIDEIESNVHYIEAEDIAIDDDQIVYDEESDIEYIKTKNNKLINYKTDLPCGLYKIFLHMEGTKDSSIRLGLEDASFYQADPFQVFERGKIYYLDNPQYSWVATNIIKNDNDPYISILIDRISGTEIKLDKIMIVKLSNGLFEFADGNSNINMFPGSTQDKQHNISVPVSVGQFTKARFTFILNYNIQTGPIAQAEYEIYLGTPGPNFQIGHITFKKEGEKNYFMLDNFSYELNNWVTTNQGQAQNGYLEIPIIVQTKSQFPLPYIVRDLVITYNESYNIGKITHPLMNDSDLDGISDYDEGMDFFVDLDATDYTNWNRYHVDELYDKDAFGSKALHVYMTLMDDPTMVPLIDEEATLEMNSGTSTKFRVLIRAKKGKGIYNAYMHAKVTDYSGNSIFSESVGLSRSLTTEYRWYHTSLFDMDAYTNFKVNISANLYGNEGSHFYLDKVYVVGATESLEFFTQTNVLCSDTDKDDVVDGVENSLNSVWIEAEDLYISPYSIEYLDKSASNSKSLKVDCSSSSNIVDSSKINYMINDKNLNYGTYSMMIRGKYGSSGNANVTVNVDGPSYTTTIYGGGYRWYSFPVQFDLNGNNNFQITQDDHYTSKIQIDKILIIKDNLMRFQYTDPYDHDIDFDGLKDGMEFNENIMSFNMEDFDQDPESGPNFINQMGYSRTLQSTESDFFMFNDLPLSDYYCKIKMKKYLSQIVFLEDSINLQIKDNSTVIIDEDIQLISESRWYITSYFNLNNTNFNDITLKITYIGEDQSIQLLIDTVQFISVQDDYNPTLTVK